MTAHKVLNHLNDGSEYSDYTSENYTPLIASLPLMSSPWPTLAIVSIYLYFILKAGPRMMEKRPPYNLKPILLLYNLAIVSISIWFVIKGINLTKGHFYMAHCHSKNLPKDIDDGLSFLNWVYLMTKLVELLDTVFFVLRKKMNQVSFLHIYHHVNMTVITWFYVRYIRAGELQMIEITNTFVHVIMYSYYFLAAMGPVMQKYLWWKKYLTKLQIIQFFLIKGYYILIFMSPGCQIPAWEVMINTANAISFITLFWLFYQKTYNKEQTKILQN